jgi:DNA-directed RNA polymerase subunit H (RpoH/RPB5)
MLTAHLTKPHRELYVGNLPPGTTGPQLVAFLNQHLTQSGMVVGTGGPMAVGGPLARAGPVITCRISGGSQFGFAEFRSVEETVLALSLGALALGALQLRFGRPKAFITLFGDDSAMAAVHAKKIMDLIAGGVPTEVPENAIAGAIFPDTCASIRAGGSGALGVPAAPLGHASMHFSQPAAPVALPGMAGAGATTMAMAGDAQPVEAAAAPSNFITPAMGAAVLAQTTATATAPAHATASSSSSSSTASMPDKSCLSLEVKGGVDLFTVEDLEGMFGAFGALVRCIKPTPAAGAEETAILEFAEKEDATTAQGALNGLDTGDNELQVRLMRVDEPLAMAPTKYVLLRNTVLEEELLSEEEAKEVLQDVAAEASTIAPVIKVHRPASRDHTMAKPAPGDAPTSVPVVIEFQEASAAAAAALKLSNRRFEDRHTTAHCISPKDFEAMTQTQPSAAAGPADEADEDLD